MKRPVRPMCPLCGYVECSLACDAEHADEYLTKQRGPQPRNTKGDQ